MKNAKNATLCVNYVEMAAIFNFTLLNYGQSK